MNNIAANSGKDLLNLYRSVADGCVECGLCQKDCRFLQEYENPKQIALHWPQEPDRLRTSFECSLCGLCTAVCPKEIDPAAMVADMRGQARDAGEGEFAGHRSLLRYERWGASPFFSWYGLPEGCDTVLFPGCALAGSRAERVIDLYTHLRQDIPALGIVLDCCTKPSHDLGRREFFAAMFGALRDALAGHGIRDVLVACPSCYRVWKDYGGPIRVRSIYEQLAAGVEPISRTAPRGEVTVHDPCPTRYDAAVQQSVRRLVSAMGYSIREMKHHGSKTVCCGEGGAACYLAPDMAGNWTRTRAGEAADTYMVTYCAGCTHFLGRLANVGHLADLYFEPEKTVAGRVRIARSPYTWLQRLRLKRRLQKLVAARVTGTRTRRGKVRLTS